MSEYIIERLAKAVMECDPDATVKVAKEIVESHVDPLKAIEEGLAKSLRRVGERFELGECFLTEMMIAATAMKEGLAVLEPAIPKGRVRKFSGKVVIGTVKGDIHDLGKSIICALLSASGFDVYDLGVDVAADKFVLKAKEVNADIVAMSALLSTTKLYMPEVMKLFKSAGVRDKVKIIVGGASVSEEWAKKIGADGYGNDASEAVDLVKKLVAQKEKCK